MDLASKIMNFSVDYKPVPNDLIGKLHNPYFVQQYKYDVILNAKQYELKSNSLAPIVKVYFDIIYKSPDQKLNSTYFMHVFTTNLWLTMVFCLISILVLLLIHHKLHKLSINTWINSTLNAFGIAVSSKPILLFSELCFNLINFVAAILCFFIGISFQTFLVSELTFNRTTTPFNGLHNFWNQSQYSLCCTEESVPFVSLNQYDLHHRILNNKNCDKFLSKTWSQSLVHMICDSNHIAFFLSPLLIMYGQKNVPK